MEGAGDRMIKILLKDSPQEITYELDFEGCPGIHYGIEKMPQSHVPKPRSGKQSGNVRETKCMPWP